MWKTIRKNYTETQDSIYYCSEKNWKASVDQHHDFFTDSRDNKTYKMVTIGNQTWMAENLKYNSVNSQCEYDSFANCNKNGRLYTWSAAMDSAGIFGVDGKNCGYHEYHTACQATYPIRGVCPEGWHLPDTTDWNDLVITLNNDFSAGLISKDDFAAYFNISNEYFWTPNTSQGPIDYPLLVSSIYLLHPELNSEGSSNIGLVPWPSNNNGDPVYTTTGLWSGEIYVRCVKNSEE